LRVEALRVAAVLLVEVDRPAALPASVLEHQVALGPGPRLAAVRASVREAVQVSQVHPAGHMRRR
jgi:hypothetical protein